MIRNDQKSDQNRSILGWPGRDGELQVSKNDGLCIKNEESVYRKRGILYSNWWVLQLDERPRGKSTFIIAEDCGQ